MKPVILIDKQDTASLNIASFLDKSISVYYLKKRSIYNEDIDKEIELKDYDFFIFATKHQGKQGKMLSLHAPGNFNKAEFGGQASKVCLTSAFILKTFSQFLDKNKQDYNATLEVTHHGPYLEKPCLFIEIGSSEEDWKNKEAGKIIAKTIQEAIKQIDKGKQGWTSAILIGGGHYNQAGNKIMIRTDYAIGHIIPKHMLEFIDEKMIQEAIDKTIPKPKIVLLDWKGLGKSKRKVVDLLEKMNLKYERIQNILKRK